MTDHYKVALQILYQLLKEDGQDHWANWIAQDIHLWEHDKSVEHHLRAYGGMGSFNDLPPLNGNATESIWKTQIFGNLQNIAYTLATGGSVQNIIENWDNLLKNNQISSWRCRNCTEAKITQRDIELYIAPKIIADKMLHCIRENRLNEALDILQLIDTPQVQQQRTSLQQLLNNHHIYLNADGNWHWHCPQCGSAEVCVYRWTIDENNQQINEADDNLPML
jgi:hypothetical protein